MTDRPKFSPGCFGSALGFKDDAVCDACDFRDQCEPVHRIARAELTAYLGCEPSDYHSRQATLRRRDQRARKAGDWTLETVSKDIPATRAKKIEMAQLSSEEKKERSREQARLRKQRQRQHQKTEK